MASQDKKYSDYSPHIALFLVQLMFGSAPVLGKVALQVFPSFAIVGFRVGGAALAFVLLQKLRGDFRLKKTSHYFYFAIFSCFGVIFNQLLFFKGLSLTNATNTSLLAVTIPIFTILISAAFGYDKLTILKLCGVGLAAAGVIYLINPANASFSSDTTQGDILIVLNSLSYATYVAASKKLISQYGALKSIAWLFLFASLINVPVGLISLSNVELSAVSFNAWIALAAIVIFPTILAYFWNAWALARVEPGIVAVYIYLQPLIGFVLAILFLGERFTSRLLISALMVFAGVFLVIRKRKLQFAETNISAD